MAEYLALRDRRLEGGVPLRPRLHIVNTNDATPLSRTFREINSVVTGKLHTMFVICHGYAGEDRIGTLCGNVGGEGLALGREGLLHENVSRWVAIKDKVSNIVVYSCAAADTQSHNAGTTADGRYLMGALAIHTNAVVYAPTEMQTYFTHNFAANGRFEFGQWEGPLLKFKPSGARPTVVRRAPVELADVFSGAA